MWFLVLFFFSKKKMKLEETILAMFTVNFMGRPTVLKDISHFLIEAVIKICDIFSNLTVNVKQQCYKNDKLWLQ